MSVTYPITDRETWLKMRQRDVTASVAGALLGVHEYMTPFQLYALKSGEITEDAEMTPAMERGQLLEPVALKLYQRERPHVSIDWNGTPGELGGLYFRDDEWRLGATPDAIATDARGRGIVQFKTVEASVFRKKWLVDSDREDEKPEASAPLWIAVQSIVEANLVEAKWAEVCALIVGYGIELRIVEVPIHQGILGRVREMTTDFWRRVADKNPPPPDYGRDGETIAALYTKDNGRTVDLRGDNELPEALERREALMATRKKTQDELNTIKAMLQHKLGPNEAAMARGWEITNKTTHRSAYTVNATSYRQVRVKRTGV